LVGFIECIKNIDTGYIHGSQSARHAHHVDMVEC
jgi:hypothetical protein